MGSPSDLTQARQEITVLEAIAKLNQASISTLKDATGLESNAIRWTLERQKGISVEKVRHGLWAYLPEPGDQPLPELTPRQQKDVLFEDWLEAQGIQHDGLVFSERNRSYLKWVRMDELQVGFMVSCGKSFFAVQKIEFVNGRYRIWRRSKSLAPTRSGQPSDLVLVKFTPDPKLYL